jgi:hypothetical protein
MQVWCPAKKQKADQCRRFLWQNAGNKPSKPLPATRHRSPRSEIDHPIDYVGRLIDRFEFRDCASFD